jgi:hypothetical protein
MIDFPQYNRERNTANKQLIFGIWIDLEGRAISSVTSGYMFSWNLLIFSLKGLS